MPTLFLILQLVHIRCIILVIGYITFGWLVGLLPVVVRIFVVGLHFCAHAHALRWFFVRITLPFTRTPALPCGSPVRSCTPYFVPRYHAAARACTPFSLLYLHHHTRSCRFTTTLPSCYHHCLAHCVRSFWFTLRLLPSPHALRSPFCVGYFVYPRALVPRYHYALVGLVVANVLVGWLVGSFILPRSVWFPFYHSLPFPHPVLLARYSSWLTIYYLYITRVTTLCRLPPEFHTALR